MVTIVIIVPIGYLELHLEVGAKVAGDAALCVTAVHAVETEGVVIRIGEVLSPNGELHIASKLKREVSAESGIEILLVRIGFVPHNVACGKEVCA